MGEGANFTRDHTDILFIIGDHVSFPSILVLDNELSQRTGCIIDVTHHALIDN